MWASLHRQRGGAYTVNEVARLLAQISRLCEQPSAARAHDSQYSRADETTVLVVLYNADLVSYSYRSPLSSATATFFFLLPNPIAPKSITNPLGLLHPPT